jgi:TonB family protein
VSELLQRERRRRERRGHEWLLVAVLVSLLVHALFFAFTPYDKPPLIDASKAPGNSGRPTAVNLVKVDKKQYDENRMTAQQKLAKVQQAKQLPEDKPLTEAEKKKVEGSQIVDIAPAANQTPPEKTKYLAEHDSTVEKESKSRFQTKDYQQPAPVPSLGAQSKPRPMQPSPAQPPSQVAMNTPPAPVRPMKEPGGGAKSAGMPEATPQQKVRTPPPAPLRLQLDPLLGMRIDTTPNPSDGQTSENERVARQGPVPGPVGQGQRDGPDGPDGPGEGPNELSAPVRPARPINLNPSPEALASLMGAPSNDRLADVDVGDATLLNAREFKFASFFNRIKRSVSQHWDPATVYRLRDPQLNIYGVRDRETVVHVTLDERGQLKDIRVMRGSGISFLDDEAMRAFRAAAPFTNPPKGLIVNGEVEFKFSFYVEVSSSNPLRMFGWQ